MDCGGGGHRTRLKDQTIYCCVYGVPLPPYIKEPRGRGRPAKEGAPRGSPTPIGSSTPFFPSWSRRRGKEEEEEKEGGRRPPLLVLFELGRGGGAAHPLPPLFLSTRAHVGPLSPRGVPVTSRYSGKIPISPGTLPMSKHRLPIYQSLCLDHFETPRHVRDHIRDS